MAPSYVDERLARRVLGPRDLLVAVRRLLEVLDPAAAGALEIRSGALSLGAKAGFAGPHGFGLKVRGGHEGRYLTLAWAEPGMPPVCVESRYLTYFRTAALALALPLRQRWPLERILVLGAGPLGAACCALAQDAVPAAEVRIWSRSGARELEWQEPGVASPAPWVPGSAESFDLVVTCTRASRPLPIDRVRPVYVAVAGAVKPDRRELPPDWLRSAGGLWSDVPELARETCGDLVVAGRPRVASLAESAAGRPGAGAQITFVCGHGGIDAGLALEVSRRVAEATPRAEHEEVLT